MNVIQEVIDALKAAQGKPIQDELLAKVFSQSASATTGLTFYDLEAPAKRLIPVLTPLRNSIPRRTGGRGIQANWKAITGINTGLISIGVGEGNRGGVIATSVAEYLAAFRGMGLEDYVTFEADYAAEGFQDLKATAALGLLDSLMIGEEKVLLGGNTSLALGTTPTPTIADVAEGGTLAANTAFSVICVALTLDGYLTGSVAGGIRGEVTRTNADGTTETYGGGAAKQSDAATVTTANDGNATHKITASVAAVEGAMGYAWFWGAAGAEKLGAITTINSTVITAVAAGTQTAASLGANDNSRNALVFDGILTQTAKTGAGYYHAMPTGTAGVGTPLTADGAGGVVEIDAALKWFWDTYRLSPSKIYVSSQEAQAITAAVLQGKANGALGFRITVEPGNVQAGAVVTRYLNKFGLNGATAIPLEQHPNLPPGTIAFHSDRLPYKLSGIAEILRVLCRRDYYQIEWPLKTRRYEYGVYFDGVLQNYAPFAFGMITNIGNG
jgi:hypothetical protein